MTVVGLSYVIYGLYYVEVAQLVKNLPAMQETLVLFLSWEDPLEEAWKPTPVFLPGESPWTEEPTYRHGVAVHGVTKGQT